MIKRCYDCGGLKRKTARGYGDIDQALCSCETGPKKLTEAEKQALDKARESAEDS